MTKPYVKPALERIEDKLDSINQRLYNSDPNCNSTEVNENEVSQEDSESES